MESQELLKNSASRREGDKAATDTRGRTLAAGGLARDLSMANQARQDEEEAAGEM